MGMLGNSTAGSQQTTYTYDRFSNMLTMTDAIGNTQNPIEPARRTEVYTYDNYGQLKAKRDRNGDTITYRYDVLGRLISETASDSEKKLPDNIRSYSYHKNGLKKSEENVHISIDFSYDSTGRMVCQVEQNRQGSAHQIVKDYSYDKAGNRTNFTMRKDGTVQLSLAYEYDKQNRLKHLKRNGQTIASYTYDQNGNRKTMTYPQSGIAVGQDLNV